MSQNKLYIPLNAGESAVLPDANTLLPRDKVYEPLAKMIIEAVKKAEAAKCKPLNELREHNAISIDGARGTGKTAVLVNLKSYLKDRDVLKDVHILDPVDPTLLEDGESLSCTSSLRRCCTTRTLKRHKAKTRTLHVA
uniref:hypothetical protein n=1 Tax=Vibrio cholerae TaxID=666 RepID=UPI003F58A361